MNILMEEKNEIIESLINQKFKSIFNNQLNVECDNRCRILYPNPDECQLAECSTKMCG